MLGVSEPLIVDVGSMVLDGRSGVVWGAACDQLNLNFVKLDAGHEVEAHVNDEVEVLMVFQGGRGVVTIDDDEHEVVVDTIVVVPIGAVRSIRAIERLLYYSIHVRRGGLLPPARP